MFLTNSELEQLTGYRLPGWQRRWLTKHQWTHEIAANGRVVVSRTYAELRLNNIQPIKTKPMLNLDAIRRRE